MKKRYLSTKPEPSVDEKSAMFLGELREESSDKVECCYGGLVGYAPPKMDNRIQGSRVGSG
jgi:hypothetical protein